MADSIGERILQSLLAAMNAPADKPATTYRTQLEAFSGKQIPAFVLESTDESIERIAQDVVRHVRKIEFECLVKSAAPPIDPVADPLVTYCLATVMADESVGGLAKHLTPTSITWGAQAALENVGVAVLAFEVTFYTKADDFTQGADL